MAKNYKAITAIPAWAEYLSSSGAISSTAKAYACIPLIFRAIRLRADALSAVPAKILPLKGKAEKEWPYPDPLDELIWKTCASLDLSGAGYWEIAANDYGYQKGVRYRNPFDMQVEFKDGVINFTQGSTGAKWQNDLKSNKFELVYFTEFDPVQDVLPGVGAGSVALQDSKLLHYVTRFASSYFEGGAVPITLLGIDAQDDDEVKRVESWFQRAASGTRNAVYKVLGIRAGAIDPKTITPALKDLVMPDLHKQAAHDVALAFGIPITMLEDAANYATAKEHRLSFYEDTIKPLSRRIAAPINRQLLARDGLQLVFDFEAMPIFQEDETDRASRFATLSNTGVSIPLAAEMAGYTPEIVGKIQDDQAERERKAKEISDGKQDPDDKDGEDQAEQELRRWERKALKRVKDGKPATCAFDSTLIPPSITGEVQKALADCKVSEDVRSVFTKFCGVAKTVNYYRFALQRAIRDLYQTGDIGRFIDVHARLIEEQFARAWREGLREVGIEADEMTAEEQKILNELIQHEEDFVLDFVAEIMQARAEGAPVQPFLARAELWANRYTDVVNQAKLIGGKNQKLEWVLGATEEHCASCLRLNGIVKRASYWNEKGVHPQGAPNDKLVCGGWRCDCRLNVTDKPLTKGPLPRLP